MNAKKLARKVRKLTARVEILEAVCGADWAQRGVVRLEGHEAVVDGPLFDALPYYCGDDDEWSPARDAYL